MGAKRPKSLVFYNFPIFQDSLVTWGVQRKDTIDLLTGGNTTFTGDNRYSVQFQNPTDWVLRYSKHNKIFQSFETF